MSDRPAGEPVVENGRAAVRDYMILCHSALLLLTLILVGEGTEWWSLLPLVVGSVSLAASWSIGPVMVLFCVTALFWQRTRYLARWEGEPSVTLDVLVAALTLVYVAGSARLLSLLRHTIPPDYRRSRVPPAPRVLGRWLLSGAATVRSKVGSANEILVLLAVAPVFVGVGVLLWLHLLQELGLGMRPEWLDRPLQTGSVTIGPLHIGPVIFGTWQLWQVMLVVWVMGMALTAAHSLLAYLGRAQASPEESLLYLQDQLWTATRGEQRRINRWVAWRRRRAQRKEEER